jgi:hypothetical protein
MLQVKSRKMSVWSFTHSCMMFALGTILLVGSAYDEFYYNRSDLPPWCIFEPDSLWNGLILGTSISFSLSVFLQDSMLVSEDPISSRKL